MIIACDVDGVVVNSPWYWYKWLEDTTQKWLTYETVSKTYNFYEHYEGHIDAETCYRWWKSDTLYDNMKPLPDAVKALEYAHNQGAEIVFVSHVEGCHGKSKFRFLHRHFPFMAGFMATREKNYVRADVAIDDRISYLKPFPTNVLKVLVDRPYNHVNDSTFAHMTIPNLTVDTMKEILNNV